MLGMILDDSKRDCSPLQSLVFLCILGIFFLFIRVHSGLLPFLQQLTNIGVFNCGKENNNPSHYCALKMNLFNSSVRFLS